ncbi:MAG: hypothetical protein EOO61_05620 [Hymenobacter sp.]|nr:MAG: hypothetical protein EOO61_05620 [Hymenobacter sp.]
MLTILASIAGILGILGTFYQPFKDLFSFLGRKKVAPPQPKLALSLVNGSRMRGRANDHMYHPFEMPEDRVITFDQQKLMAYDWDLRWSLKLRITNQTDNTAYKVKLIPFGFDEQYVKIHLQQPIDYTRAFIPNETTEIDVVCNVSYRGRAEEADAIIKKYPFKELRIEYSNMDGERFATVFSAVETDDEKKNQYFALGKPQLVEQQVELKAAA